VASVTSAITTIKTFLQHAAYWTLRCFDALGGLAIKTRHGAALVRLIVPSSRPLLCSACFMDHGLQLDAERVGIVNALPCPNCGTTKSRKLTLFLTKRLAHRFFVRGSVFRTEYGAAPLVQFNEMQYGTGDYRGPIWLHRDVCLINEAAKIGLFHYGPRFWMLGHVEPLQDLQNETRRGAIIERILKEYPTQEWKQGRTLYRLRVNPETPSDHAAYDSPPMQFLGNGRFDCASDPVLYCSQDVEGCVHECRVTVEDDLFIATLALARDLKLLDLTELLFEECVTEFESLDMAVHMLFYAGKHSYPVSREIACAAKVAGFDGIVYPSFFSQVRSGIMPFETTFGISVRRFPRASEYAKSGVYPNVALFGRPVEGGLVTVACIDRVILHKVHYDVHFGPVQEVAAVTRRQAADEIGAPGS
jgi:hypothetical protein